MPTASPTSESFEPVVQVWPAVPTHQTGPDVVSVAPPAPPSASAEDLALVARLRRGDEDAFVLLLDQHHAALLRLARVWVADSAAAEEVVQETWLALFRGLDRFQGRSSLKTWLFAILANQAKRRGQREHRIIPFSALRAGGRGEQAEGDAEHFFPPDHPAAGRWAAPPRPWAEEPLERLVRGELRDQLLAAVETLPPSYRAVLVLRDIEGRSSDETCNILGLTATNQRVLLHRARSRLRSALAPILEGDGAPPHAPDHADLPGAG